MISPNTSCEHCCFKLIDKVNQKQTGCLLGRIGKFIQQGTSVRTEDKHFVIENRFCNALRSDEWCDKQSLPVLSVKKEIAISCDIIINIVDDFDKLIFRTFDEVTKTIDSAISQTLSPKVIHVINKAGAIDNTKIWNYLCEKTPDNIEYLMHSVVLDEVPLVDIAVSNCFSQFYTVFYPPFVIPNTFLADLDDAVNEKLDRFCLLEPLDNGNGLVVLKKVHDKLNGNRAFTLEQYEDGELIGYNMIDKVKFLSEQTNQPHMMKKVEDICLQMSHCQS